MENQIKANQKRIQLIQSENQKLISALGKYKAHIPDIHALNGDTHTLFLSILIMNSRCVGAAIEAWIFDLQFKPFLSDCVNVNSHSGIYDAAGKRK